MVLFWVHIRVAELSQKQKLGLTHHHLTSSLPLKSVLHQHLQAMCVPAAATKATAKIENVRIKIYPHDKINRCNYLLYNVESSEKLISFPYSSYSSSYYSVWQYTNFFRGGVEHAACFAGKVCNCTWLAFLVLPEKWEMLQKKKCCDITSMHHHTIWFLQPVK